MDDEDREYYDRLNAGLGSQAENVSHSMLENAAKNKAKGEKVVERLRKKRAAKVAAKKAAEEKAEAAKAEAAKVEAAKAEAEGKKAGKKFSKK